MVFTVEECRKHLQEWLNADYALATGKSYQIGTQNLTRADGPIVKERIAYWRRELEIAQSYGRKRKFYRFVPVDS